MTIAVTATILKMEKLWWWLLQKFHFVHIWNSYEAFFFLFFLLGGTYDHLFHHHRSRVWIKIGIIKKEKELQVSLSNDHLMKDGVCIFISLYTRIRDLRALLQ